MEEEAVLLEGIAQELHVQFGRVAFGVDGQGGGSARHLARHGGGGDDAEALPGVIVCAHAASRRQKMAHFFGEQRAVGRFPYGV